MRAQYQLYTFIVFSFVVVVLSNCARQVAPTGGPIDSIAPCVVAMLPPNQTSNLNTKRIVIEFDEFFTLDNAEQNIMLSPPVKTKPKVKQKGKKMIIDISKCELRANRTYTILLDNIVKDLTQDNPVKSLQYVFSTGASVDSLCVSGTLIDAQTLAPIKDAYVVLYSNLHDTMFRTTIPDFVAKTNDKGNFSIYNVEDTTYRLYALLDSDKDFTYNQENEQIAFCDSIVKPYAFRKAFVDTLRVDSTIIAVDSLPTYSKDSTGYFKTVNVERTVYKPSDIVLRMFKEPRKKQYLSSYTRTMPQCVSLKFNIPLVGDSIHIQTLDNALKTSGYTIENVSNNDSICLWFSDNNCIKNDSLSLLVGYFKHDSALNARFTYDTVSVPLSQKVKAKQTGGFTLSSNIKTGAKINSIDTLYFATSTLVQTIDTAYVKLYKTRDTLAMVSSIGNFFERDTANNEIYITQVEPKVLEASGLKKNVAQSVVSYRYAQGKCAIGFAKSIKDENVILRSLDFPELTDFYISEKDLESNSLLCWFTNEKILMQKQPRFSIVCADTAFTVPLKFDDDNIGTYRFAKRNKQKLYVNQLHEKALPINEMLEIIAGNPISSFDTSKISIINTADSLSLPLKYLVKQSSMRRLLFSLPWIKATNYIVKFERGAITDIYNEQSKEWEASIAIQKPKTEKLLFPTLYSIVADTANTRQFVVQCERVDKQSYRFLMLPGAVVDMYNEVNDSLLIDYSVASAEALGVLKLRLNNISQRTVVQLCDDKYAQVFRTIAIDKSGEYVVKDLQPRQYKLKFIFDSNRNNTYDTGNLDTHMQPEKVGFYQKPIVIKANWDITADVDLNTVKEK